MADTVLYRCKTKHLQDLPVIVGIDGLGGSGKTTLAKKLSQDLNKQNYEEVIIHMDDYIVERNKRYQTGYAEWYEYYYLQWNIEMLKNVLFHRLKNNYSKLTLPFYDEKTDSISTKIMKVNPNSIVLIEGVFLQRKEWREFFDFLIFIDCPHKLRIERVLNRDLYIGDYQARINKYKKRYLLGEEHYLNIANPIENADEIFTLPY